MHAYIVGKFSYTKPQGNYLAKSVDNAPETVIGQIVEHKNKINSSCWCNCKNFVQLSCKGGNIFKDKSVLFNAEGAYKINGNNNKAVKQGAVAPVYNAYIVTQHNNLTEETEKGREKHKDNGNNVFCIQNIKRACW